MVGKAVVVVERLNNFRLKDWFERVGQEYICGGGNEKLKQTT